MGQGIAEGLLTRLPARPSAHCTGRSAAPPQLNVLLTYGHAALALTRFNALLKHSKSEREAASYGTPGCIGADGRALVRAQPTVLAARSSTAHQATQIVMTSSSGGMQAAACQRMHGAGERGLRFRSRLSS